MLLNLTSRRQVDQVWPALFGAWPTPEAAAEWFYEERAVHNDVYLHLALLGLQRRRYNAIVTFSQQWLECGSDAQGLIERDRMVTSMGFHGVGEYARDSWIVFMQGPTDENVSFALQHEGWPGDKELAKWFAPCRDAALCSAVPADAMQEGWQWQIDHPGGYISPEEHQAMADYVAETSKEIG